ncbi:isochorismatase family protein [Streptomyces sp. NPDC007117]|uniref:isochorismatase family protein n=1 Tax=Streptomyces sp. NPDC007117 TaxID=3154314 RepID=UPI0033CEEFB9
MALPAIAPYPMPGPEQLPDNTVNWALDPNRAALLIHDMQNHFLAAFSSGQPPLSDLIDNVNALRQACTRRSIPVIYSAQPGGQSQDQRGLLQDFWGSGVPNTPGSSDITDALHPSEGDIQLTKWRYSAFARTDLAEQLAASGRDQLIICGVYAHLGCLLTAADAFMRDIQPFFVVDALADFTPALHRQALSYAAERCAKTITTQDLTAQLQ